MQPRNLSWMYDSAIRKGRALRAVVLFAGLKACASTEGHGAVAWA
jgi:hypothetical protein